MRIQNAFTLGSPNLEAWATNLIPQNHHTSILPSLLTRHTERLHERLTMERIIEHAPEGPLLLSVAMSLHWSFCVAMISPDPWRLSKLRANWMLKLELPELSSLPLFPPQLRGSPTSSSFSSSIHSSHEPTYKWSSIVTRSIPSSAPPLPAFRHSLQVTSPPSFGVSHRYRHGHCSFLSSYGFT